MIPIFEQGSGKGIGHGFDSFIKRFEEIAIEHYKTKRAKSFAFIFYDFTDRDFKRILKDEGVFAKLDRLSGSELSVFYLHSGSSHSIDKFNSTLISALGVEKEAHPPCVVFCKASDNGFKDISVALLESPDIVHGFQELYEVIESYINGRKDTESPKYIQWIKGSVKFVSLESIKTLVREVLKGGVF